MKRHWTLFWFAMLGAIVLTVIIERLGFRLDEIKLLPDKGAAWYYWKLPDKQFFPRFTAWSFYTVHQIVIWVMIYRQQNGERLKLWKRNIELLIVNGVFIILHILQTHIWYDGLAQDVPVWSSQGSVIVMLVLILILENDRRGIFFGKKINGFQRIKQFIRKYHGYYISWAIIYTFWYHPTVNTSGHLFGFFYMFLLFIQLSMAYTKVHTNKYWLFAIEVLVLAHGTAVAVYQGNNMWPMFAFGFGMMAVVTQLYGLKLSKPLRYTLQIVYFIGVIIVFGGFTGHRTIGQIHQILWIPIIEYALVFIFILIGEGILKMSRISNSKDTAK